MKILYITRKYPPTTGGLENAAYQLYESLKKKNQIKLIKWGGSNIFLPVIFPLHLLRAIRHSIFNEVDVIYIQDGLLAPLGYLLKKLFKRPVVLTAAGLDVTYNNWVYQTFFAAFIKHLDFVICISEQTKKAVTAHGVDTSKTAIIPYGIDDVMPGAKDEARRELEKKLNINLDDRIVILSLGRLVKRKGIHWFVNNVMPGLRKKYPNLIYLIAGDGSYKNEIKKSIRSTKQESSIFMLGKVSDEVKKLLYDASDLFVMPNISVDGDIEGQGLVMLEASMAKLPVVATGIDGITSTVCDGKNGFLINEKDEKQYISTLDRLVKDRQLRSSFGQKSRIYTKDVFGWGKIGAMYLKIFRKLARNQAINKTKVCYVLSYKDPNYVRTVVLVDALKEIEEIQLTIVKNTSRSLLRYIQTAYKLMKTRIFIRPDVYILGFRGHEAYWPVRAITFPKPIIFDEFIDSSDWLLVENKNRYIPKIFLTSIKWVTKSILHNASAILTDTQLNAKSSSKNHGISKDKYQVIYVGTDENTFRPHEKKPDTNESLEVFFYGTLAPLHGLEYILEAAKAVQGKKIHFTIVGGRGKPVMVHKIKQYIKENKLQNVSYKEWVNYEEIPELINQSDVFLAGPFGDTSQSKRVITGKAYQSLCMAKATMMGGIKEEVGFIDKQNCLIVDQGSSLAIADALEWAKDHKSKLDSIGQKGKELYKTRFSRETIKKQLTRVINNLEKIQ